jgi:hypothetical protein
MITLDRATVYGEALFGEPLVRLVRYPPLNTDSHFWIVGDWTIVLPETAARPAPEVQRAIADLRGWTGWSARRLADVLGTSHTTVLRIEDGRPLMEGHSGDLRRRVADVHDVVKRIYLLADRDSAATVRLLETRSGGTDAPVDALQRGDLARAYLRAIDAVRPRETGLLVGGRPRREGATIPLHD